MAGLRGLYEQMDRTVEAPYDGGTDEPPSMVMCLLYVAEPMGLRDADDLEEARATLRWAQCLWNLVRMTTDDRETYRMKWADDLVDYAWGPGNLIEITVRARAWPNDRRVVGEARIDVEPSGAWRVAVASVVPPIPTPRRSSGP